MTRTEGRLTDALAARAAAVREDSLRPLIASERGRAGAGTGLDQRRGWRARLAPLAAAAAMLFVIGGTIFAVHELRGAASASFADVGTAHAPPPYYVDLDWNRILTVQATSTGRVTDRLSPPYPWDGDRADILDTALASTANGRTFVVVYDDEGMGKPYHTGIYTFTLTSAGHIADFKPVKGGMLPALARLSVAVSPDGSEVAIAGAPQRGVEAAIDHGFPMPPSRIVVVNLRTGRRVVFQGGMDRRGMRFGITDVSWANDGQSLAYLAQWCPQLDLDREFYLVCAFDHSVTELRMISVTDNGGSLSGGRTLLRDSRAYPSILQALVSPDGRSIVAMTERGHEIRLVQFDLRTGAPIATLYSRHALSEKDYGPGPWIALLSSDGTGQYLIFDEDLGSVDGWVHDGNFHPMKIGPLPGELESAPAW